MPYDCEKIMAIADKYGIPVVEDAAEGPRGRASALDARRMGLGAHWFEFTPRGGSG